MGKREGRRRETHFSWFSHPFSRFCSQPKWKKERGEEERGVTVRFKEASIFFLWNNNKSVLGERKEGDSPLLSLTQPAMKFRSVGGKRDQRGEESPLGATVIGCQRRNRSHPLSSLSFSGCGFLERRSIFGRGGFLW